MTTTDQEHEENLIAKGFDSDPMNSLRELMHDIGITNLIDRSYSPQCHFDMNNLDREFMRRLIGRQALARNKGMLLLTSFKGPDDKSAYRVSGSVDFGEETHPKVLIQGQIFDLVSVEYDIITERFLIKVHPVNNKDFLVDIRDLRALIGRFKGPFKPGKMAPWASSLNTSFYQPVEWSWGWIKKKLHIV